MESPSLEARRATVRQVRKLTGLGMMDCWKLLVQNGWDEQNEWDEQKILQWLGFQPKPPAAPITLTTEIEPNGVAAPIQQPLKAGVIESYIHLEGCVGSLVELTCKTQSVAQGEIFKNLAKEIAMQICTTVVPYVNIADVSPEAIAQERTRILQGFESENQDNEVDIATSDQIIASMIQEHFASLPLLQQPCLQDSNITLQDRIHQVQRIVGEPIQIRRWVKFCLGAATLLPADAQPQYTWLLEDLYNAKSWVRWQAISTSPAFGKSALPYLIRALQDSEGAIRYRAAETLGVLGDSSCVPALIQSLQDSENWVRWKAAEALGRLKDPMAVPALVELLKNYSGCVFLGVKRSGCWASVDMRALYRIAADALAEIGNPKAIELLLQTLADLDGCKRLPSGAKPQEIASLLQRLGYPLSLERSPD